MGGIMAQTLVFAAFGAAMSIANDQKNQAVDRFRSLPIARGAVLGGYAVANVLKTMLPIIIMSLTGLLIGWRIRASFLDAVAAYALMIAFAFAMIWVGILLGSLVGTPRGRHRHRLRGDLPAHVHRQHLRAAGVDARRACADHRASGTRSRRCPTSLRELFGNPNTPVQPGDPWSIAHPVAYTCDLDRRDHRRVRPAGGAPLLEDHLQVIDPGGGPARRSGPRQGEP